MKQLTSIILFFLSTISYGQVLLDARTEEEEFKVNQSFTFTIVMEIQGEDMVQQSPLKLPDFSKFNVIGSASEHNEVLLDKGYVRQLVIQYVLQPKQTGRIKLGSALVTVNGVKYKSEPFDIFVKEPEKKVIAEKPSRDLYLNVELENPEVYRNQPTVAVLKAYSKNYNNFRKVKNIQLPEQKNVSITPVSFKKSDIESNRTQMSSQVLAIFMVFANESGTLELEPVSATYFRDDAKELLSNKVKLKVKNLPGDKPADYKNAVGNFELDVANMSVAKAEVRKPVNVRVKLSGEGNFPNISLPQIKESEDYQVFPPKITHKTVVSRDGIKGEVIADYVIIPLKAGLIQISTDNFTFFNPEKKEYIDLGAKSIDVTTMTHDEILNQRSTLERINDYTNNVLETVDNPVIQTEPLKVEEKNKMDWKTLLINVGIIALLVTLYLLFVRWKKNRSKINDNLKPVGSIEETEKEIKGQLKSDIQDHFNYLALQLENNDFNAFFNAFDEMDSEVRMSYFNKGNEGFKSILEREHGSRISESYRDILQKIQVEKYAPIHSEDSMKDLLKEIETLYSVISK